MSIRVADVMKLPSLRGARVRGGAGGLDKIVLGVSVLESVEVRNLNDLVFRDGDYPASELVITGFLNCIHDVDTQCANLRRLAEGGEVGLVLFYVGDLLPEVDPRLIALADELDFVLIRMSSGLDRRYGEVIREVSELLYQDRTKDENIVTDVLAAIGNLPEQRRAVNNILKILSDRLRVSAVLTDSFGHVLNLAAWPTGAENLIGQHLSTLVSMSAASDEKIFVPPLNAFVQHAKLPAGAGLPMELYLIKESPGLTENQKKQAVDAIRLSVNLWGRDHDRVVSSELIRAILQDDPIKMRRLAGIFHVNIKDLHNLWIFSGGDACIRLLQEQEEELKEALASCCEYVIGGFYEDCLVLCTSNPAVLRADEDALFPLLSKMQQQAPMLKAVVISRIQTVTEANDAFLCFRQYLSDAEKIFHERRVFTRGELDFTRSCSELIAQGETTVAGALTHLDLVRSAVSEWDVVQTLSVYLLDADNSVTRTAEMLHVHKNTVKYRLKVIANLLGYPPGKLPDNIALYKALAIQRLLK